MFSAWKPAVLPRRPSLRHPTTRLPGENPPPVEYAPEIAHRGPDPDQAESSLDWRSIIAGARLTGPLRNLAASAQVLELTRTHVKLRLRVAAFATETGRELLSRALSSYFGSHCMVEFEVGDVSEGTVADQEESEREEARKALIDGFRNDPFVKQVQALFHGTIDDATVKAIED